MSDSLGLSAVEVLSTTRSVRRRMDLSRPVPPEVVRACLDLATQAPTGRNRQHWEFVVVTDPALRAALARYCLEGMTRPSQPVVLDDSDRWDPAARAKVLDGAQEFFARLHEVPVMVIPCVRMVRTANPSVVQQSSVWGSILPAAWSFMLAAREHGLGTVFLPGHLHHEREVAGLLGIDYDNVLQTAMIPVAYTRGTSFRRGPRVPAESVTHWNRWGNRSAAGR
ncbi:nitroreductase family protein [Amycolatopsis ultiminotia]|uniref:Nitroreductase family protein n=1 Tax=Amycolatopsis ultiminotia TaxID=543629 RepID=A0ABP6UYH1_9PSEU